jgi:hypothetical protein
MATLTMTTIGEQLHWCYANLGMAEFAVHQGDKAYTSKHFALRNRLHSGLKRGTMAPRSLMRDQKIRMKLPQECIYCGSTLALAIDHVIPTNRGGADSGDNAVWSCRSCNSSKADRDLFAWWSACRDNFPPLFAVRVYLKQAIQYFTHNSLMGHARSDAPDSPFSLKDLPSQFPEPDKLIFSPFHARKKEDPKVRLSGINP